MTTETSASEEEVAPPSFEQMPLSDGTQAALKAMGWSAPTPVQLETYGPATDGHDLIVQARTGTGKTGAFGLPIIDRLIDRKGGTQALLLSPTRELALQSAKQLSDLALDTDIKVTAVYGGAPMAGQVRDLEDGAEVISGTPGRVLDHLKRGNLNGEDIRILVLDEADEMLSMGFARELNAIMEQLSQERQTLLFSATVDDDVKRMAKRHMQSPMFVTLSGDVVGASTVAHYAYSVSGVGRSRDLIRILQSENPESAIIFCNTKAETESTAAALQQAGYSARWLNGDLAQREREKIMAQTRDSKLRFLVATDVAARGIDISHLTHVINFSFPQSAAQYIHRTGRTGRAGRTGTAISLVSAQELGSVYFLRLQYKIFPIERSLPSAGEESTRREADRIILLESTLKSRPSAMDTAVAQRLLTHPNREQLIAMLIGEALGKQAGDTDEIAADARRQEPPAPAPAVASPEREEAPAKQRRRRTRTKRAAEPPAKETAAAVEASAEASADEVTQHEVPTAKRRQTRRRSTSARDSNDSRESRDSRSEPRRARTETATENSRPRRSPVRKSQEEAPKESSAKKAAPLSAGEGELFLKINVGRNDGAKARDLGIFILKTAELPRSAIRRVRVRDATTILLVGEEYAKVLLSEIPGESFGGKALKMARVRSRS